MTDLLIVAALLVVAVFIAAVVMTVPPGAWPRYVHGRRYHRAGLARHARREPDLVTTIPDALTVRTT